MTRQSECEGWQSLDRANAVALPPDAWPRNLEALSRVAPHVAAAVQSTELPRAWRPVSSLDGVPTYRLEPPGHAPVWLGGTAAPRTRAAALTAQYVIGDLNATLPAPGTGYELDALLGRLPSVKAVYVFVADLSDLVASLHLVDVSQALSAGRCRFILPRDEEEQLAHLLDESPGLLPPGNILVLPDLPRARLEQLRTWCQRVAGRMAEHRAARLRELSAAPRTPLGVTDPPRLAVLSLELDGRALRAAADVCSAAKSLDWPAELCGVHGPDSVHVLAHCEALARFHPTLSIFVNSSRARFPIVPGGAELAWFLRARDVPQSSAVGERRCLAATPQVAETLRAAGARDVIDFFWAWREAPQGRECDAGTATHTVLLAGEESDTSPERWGIIQPTHVQLWQRLWEVARANWERPVIYRPAALLQLAESASGIRIGEEDVRLAFCRGLEAALVPGAVLDAVRQELARSGLRVVRLSGAPLPGESGGTEPSAAPGWLPADVGAVNLRPPGVESPLAVVFAGQADPLSRELVEAAGRGWPILLHGPGGDSRVDALGGIVVPGEHYQPFSGTVDLRRLLDQWRMDTRLSRGLGQRAAAWVRARHRYGDRLHHLLNVLRGTVTLSASPGAT